MATWLAAFVFVVSSGGLFTETFRKYFFLRLLATCVACVSASLFVLSVSSDVRGFLGRGTALSDDDFLVATPRTQPIAVSNFDYLVVDSSERVTFVFPPDALRRLEANTHNGDMASSGFAVTISDKLEISCVHFITIGASPGNIGYRSYAELLPVLQCSAWLKDEHGSGTLISDIDVSIEFDLESHQINILLEDTGAFRLERSNLNSPCRFTLSNIYGEFVEMYRPSGICSG